MARGRDWFLGLLLIAALGIFVFFVASLFFGTSDDGIESFSGKRVGLVEIKGVIIDSEPILKQIEQVSEDDGIAAVILRIDSPGGGVAASQEIYEAVKDLAEDKFVVASMASVAASGGYYVACGADTIMANPGTITGSIGVIAEFINVKELLNKIGVRFEIVKSGKYKDTGTPFRSMDEEDRRYLQQNVDNVFRQFVTVVAEERGFSMEEIMKHADGRVYTGEQAQEIGLIDLLGAYPDAVDLAAEMAGIEGKARVVTPRKRRVTIWDLIFGDLEEHVARLQTLPVLRYQLIL